MVTKGTPTRFRRARSFVLEMTINDDLIRIIRIRDENGEEKVLKVPAKLDLERPKRARTVFTDEQLQVLERTFNEKGYLSAADREILARRLVLSDNQIKVWFQNRRTKQKRLEQNNERNLQENGTQFVKTVHPFLYMNTFVNYVNSTNFANNDNKV